MRYGSHRRLVEYGGDGVGGTIVWVGGLNFGGMSGPSREFNSYTVGVKKSLHSISVPFRATVFTVSVPFRSVVSSAYFLNTVYACTAKRQTPFPFVVA